MTTMSQRERVLGNQTAGRRNESTARTQEVHVNHGRGRRPVGWYVTRGLVIFAIGTGAALGGWQLTTHAEGLMARFLNRSVPAQSTGSEQSPIVMATPTPEVTAASGVSIPPTVPTEVPAVVPTNTEPANVSQPETPPVQPENTPLEAAGIVSMEEAQNRINTFLTSNKDWSKEGENGQYLFFNNQDPSYPTLDFDFVQNGSVGSIPLITEAGEYLGTFVLGDGVTMAGMFGIENPITHQRGVALMNYGFTGPADGYPETWEVSFGITNKIKPQWALSNRKEDARAGLPAAQAFEPTTNGLVNITLFYEPSTWGEMIDVARVTNPAGADLLAWLQVKSGASSEAYVNWLKNGGSPPKNVVTSPGSDISQMRVEDLPFVFAATLPINN